MFTKINKYFNSINLNRSFDLLIFVAVTNVHVSHKHTGGVDFGNYSQSGPNGCQQMRLLINDYE